MGKQVKKISREDACEILETVLDTLVEVGNGISDEDLHNAADMLFEFRDCYFKFSDLVE